MEKNKMNWISVKDKKPPEGRYVLILGDPFRNCNLPEDSDDYDEEEDARS